MSKRFILNLADYDGNMIQIWQGYDSPTLHLQAIAELGDLTNAGITGGTGTSIEDLSLGSVPTGPTGGRFSTVRDYARLTFNCDKGLYNLDIPAPRDAIFLDDDETVDKGHADVQAFVTAAIENLRSTYDDALVELLEGRRRWNPFWTERASEGLIPVFNYKAQGPGDYGSWLVDFLDNGGNCASAILWSGASGADLLADVLPELQALSSARIVHQQKHDDRLGPPYKTTPVNGTYSIDDLLLTRFSTVGGEELQMYLPAPKDSIFESDGYTLDTTLLEVTQFANKAVAGFVKWEPGPSVSTDNELVALLGGTRLDRNKWPATRREGLREDHTPREDID